MAPRLQANVEEYARLLQGAGFDVWAPTGDRREHAFFHYTIDGFWGTVQRARVNGWSHTMPVKPSTEWRSAVATVWESWNAPTVDDARKTAQAHNGNEIVPVMTGTVPYGIGYTYALLEQVV